MNANGTGPTRLTTNIAGDDQPAWSPDGTLIAFRSDRNGYFQIYVMNANGTGQTNISNSGTPDTQPTWQVAPDTDDDGILDEADNCTLVANPSQCDSDTDGYGNGCDGDLNNNAFTNAQDTILFRAQLGQASIAPTYNQADLNCNTFVNAQDTILFRGRLGKSSGPSGLH